SLGLSFPSGAYVSDVYKGSPAAQCGLAKGDVVIEYDGETVCDDAHLSRLSALGSVGDEVGLKVLRGGRLFDAKVKLAAKASFLGVRAPQN
ncbi:MAG: PDZ domain-containing protein, partial [Thermoguttaceae bacterium]|nr:PDZ domain-containing protein [Thermoguttaceae bacterium]